MATVTVRSGHYILNWSEGGRQRRKSLGRVGVLPKADAEAIRKAKELELSQGFRLLNIRRAPTVTFSQFAVDYLAWHRGEYPDSHFRVAQIVKDHLEPAFGITPLDLISIEAVEQFKSTRRFSAKSGTVTKELRTLQAMLNRAVTLKALTQNPVASVAPPKSNDSKPHLFYEAEQLEKLYAAASGPRVWIWRLMANTGLRRGEALNLRRAWVLGDTIRILSTDEERTKSGEWREIPISDGARLALQHLGFGEFVLPSVALPSLSRAFARDAARAGLPGSLHTLRHTYISHLVRAGIPLRTVQIYAGHAHYSTTEKYAYLNPGRTPEQALRLAI